MSNIHVFKKYLAEVLIVARSNAGVNTQKEMAELLDVDQATVSALESGKRYLSTKTLESYAEALGMDIEIVFSRLPQVMKGTVKIKQSS